MLLTELYFHGPLSRQELSQRTGLSSATVSTVTGGLIDERLVVPAGLVDSDGGRPRVLLRVDPCHGHLIGVDVGETGVTAELFDLSMRPVAVAERPAVSSSPQPDGVATQVADAIGELTSRADVDHASVVGIGVGVPGIVERTPRVSVHAQSIGWEAVPFEDLLRAAGVDRPLFLENGAKVQGQAELWFGAGRGAQHAVVILVGSGVSAAVVTDGRAYQGASGSAGEWGHTTLVYEGRPCRCGDRGCLEAYVGAGAVLDRYRSAHRGRPAPGADDRSRLAALVAAAPRSPAAAAVLAETAEYLGAGIADLVNLFNPERIILGGWAGVVLGGTLLPAIRAAARTHALRHPYQRVVIEMCQLGPDAVAFGAATLPLAALLDRGDQAFTTIKI